MMILFQRFAKAPLLDCCIQQWSMLFITAVCVTVMVNIPGCAESAQTPRKAEPSAASPEPAVQWRVDHSGHGRRSRLALLDEELREALAEASRRAQASADAAMAQHARVAASPLGGQVGRSHDER